MVTKFKLNNKDIEVAVFDLDGTLISQDSLLEQTMIYLKYMKLKSLYLIPLLLSKGIIFYKKALFEFNEKLDKNTSCMKNIEPNQNLLILLNEYRTHGKKIVVATAAYFRTAIKVLGRIDLLPDVLIATNTRKNLKGKQKLIALSKEINGKKWAYFGDSSSDIPLFKVANLPFLVQKNNIVEWIK
tara:strand:- start:103 stop:657 length:555 start_codon:yes stop_codon:yes gene_type:complete